MVFKVTNSHRQWRWRVTGALWLGAIIIGMALAVRHQMTPGRAAAAPVIQPSELASDRPTLIMFVHPDCPCTSASFAELARALTRCPDSADVRIIFFKPSEKDSTVWMTSASWRKAQEIPGAKVIRDIDGGLTHRFGAYTSGQVLLYSTKGKLLFSGGITDSRGHEGDNDGEDALIDFLQHPDQADAYSASPRTTPVYGCPITNQDKNP